MNRILREVSLAVSLGCLPITCLAGTFYVASPPQGDDANPGTEARPFASVQRGIDAALVGDTVVVGPGTYLETVRFKGKNIVLTSTDPLDPIVVSQTIIDGNGARLAVVFDSTETGSCVLAGFTVTRGSLIGSDGLGAGIRGGAANRRTRATIRNNRIIANLEVGVAYCDGLIEANTISDNTSWQSAGGMAYRDGVIRGNCIASNRTFKDSAAGGLAWCGGLIEDNTIVDNEGLEHGAIGRWPCLLPWADSKQHREWQPGQRRRCRGRGPLRRHDPGQPNHAQHSPVRGRDRLCTALSVVSEHARRCVLRVKVVCAEQLEQIGNAIHSTEVA